MSRSSTAELARGLAFVGVAVFFFATSPVLTRWAAPFTPFEITFGRMVVAAFTILAFLVVARQRVVLSRADIPRFFVFGLTCALHFLLYISSLSYTTIAHSLALVYTAPVFVTLLAAAFLGEPVVRRQWFGLGIAVAGVGLLTGFEPAMTPTMAFGDLLAIGSAVCFGFYSIIGRRERGRYPLLTYALAMYAAAAVWLAPPALTNLTHEGITIRAVLAILALGILPLGLGHTLYNASLRRVHPTYVNLIATQEVTGGIVLGYLFLGEAPSAVAIGGALVTLLGIVIVLVCRQDKTGRPAGPQLGPGGSA
ncbi:MAG: DMT family transporter [Chloroflexi bacterium]|nr:DMT family transporter [Chloroflexota bacterium]